MLGVTAAVDKLGLSRSHIYNTRSAGELPGSLAVRAGSKLLFDERDLDLWIETLKGIRYIPAATIADLRSWVDELEAESDSRDDNVVELSPVGGGDRE
jgi:predicted DNA-binding transcriptional regulator AlpA